jgi:coenzyme Q-binding protein COQ10
MAEATRTETWDCPIEQIYETLTDYAAYADYVAGVDGISVLDQNEDGARVEYSLNLIKKFKYILKLTHKRPTQISWCFESGDLFKQNDGHWELKDLGDGKTEVTYGLEVNIKGFAPKAIVNGLTSKNLPAMMESFHNRAKSRGQ